MWICWTSFFPLSFRVFGWGGRDYFGFQWPLYCIVFWGLKIHWEMFSFCFFFPYVSYTSNTISAWSNRFDRCSSFVDVLLIQIIISNINLIIYSYHTPLFQSEILFRFHLQFPYPLSFFIGVVVIVTDILLAITGSILCSAFIAKFVPTPASHMITSFVLWNPKLAARALFILCSLNKIEKLFIFRF